MTMFSRMRCRRSIFSNNKQFQFLSYQHNYNKHKYQNSCWSNGRWNRNQEIVSWSELCLVSTAYLLTFQLVAEIGRSLLLQVMGSFFPKCRLTCLGLHLNKHFLLSVESGSGGRTNPVCASKPADKCRYFKVVSLYSANVAEYLACFEITTAAWNGALRSEKIGVFLLL